MPEISELARQFYSNFPQPHPTTGRPLSVTVGQWHTMMELANHSKFGAQGGHATPEEIEAFHKEFKELEMEPEDYKHLLDQLAPLSATYHGRPPTMKEVARHRTSSPEEMRRYYAGLPNKLYPQVTAGEMVHALESARFYSNFHHGRDPYPNEALYFHHVKAGGTQIDQHYARMKDDVRDRGGGTDAGGPGAPSARRFVFGRALEDPPAASPGTATATWHGGVLAGGASGSAQPAAKDGSG